MRLIAASLLALAACGGARGPAWPRSAGYERQGEAADDGGESLAPRVAAEVAAIEAGGAPAVEAAAPVAAKAEATPAPAPAAPVGAGTGDPTPQLIELEEEIIITDGP